MEIFIRVKELLKILGFLQFNHPHKKMIAIVQNSICFSVLILSLLSYFWTFRFETDKFFEKTESISLFFVCILLLITYSIFLWQRQRLLELITQFECKITERM